MKQGIKTILLGMLAGFLGAYLFSLIPNANKEASIPVKEAPIRAAFAKNSLVKGSSAIDFSVAAAKSTASVVYIKSISKRRYQRRTWADLFFNPNAGGKMQTQKQVMGSGSGVIFSEDGYIVTNNHVIEGADELQVIHHKKTYAAQLIGTDPSTDLALLKIEAQGLPNIVLGSSKEVRVGEWVLAVGNPFNLTSTVTAGIVSAKGRKINILEDLFPIESFIQTDAAINPGNSGGALVNQAGELVGINTAILSQTGSYAGYGFAVPVDIAVKVVNDLRQYGEVQKVFIGADIMGIDSEVATKLKLKSYDGVLVTEVDPQGAAMLGGLERGDIISMIDGENIDSEADFNEQLSYYQPGTTIKVGYLRKGNYQETKVILTNINGTTGVAKREIFKAEALGATFEIVPKVEKQRLGIDNGIRITEVNQGLIRRMGLGEGFVIVALNNYAIETPQELSQILQNIRGRVVLQGVNKSGEYKYYTYRF